MIFLSVFGAKRQQILDKTLLDLAIGKAEYIRVELAIIALQREIAALI